MYGDLNADSDVCIVSAAKSMQVKIVQLRMQNYIMFINFTLNPISYFK